MSKSCADHATSTKCLCLRALRKVSRGIAYASLLIAPPDTNEITRTTIAKGNFMSKVKTSITIFVFAIIALGNQNCAKPATEVDSSDTSAHQFATIELSLADPDDEYAIDPVIAKSGVDDPSCSDIEIKNVFINVAQVTFNGNNDVLVGPGVVDLMTLDTPIRSIQFTTQAAVSATQIRLLIVETGSRVILADGSEVTLKVPSQDLRLLVPGGFKLDSATAYIAVASTDKASMKLHGAAGKCLLRPVIKIDAIARAVDVF